MQIKECGSCNYTKPIQEFIKTSSYCKECRSKYNKEWRLINRPTRPSISEDELKLKKEIQKEKNRNRVKKYRQNNRIAVNMRSRISIAFKKGIKRSSSWSLMGCSQQSYIQYLEGLFDKDMSWDNYGSYWEIDHIVPCSHFNLTDCEQQKKCFHYTNTQPLIKSINRYKGNRYIG